MIIHNEAEFNAMVLKLQRLEDENKHLWHVINGAPHEDDCRHWYDEPCDCWKSEANKKFNNEN